MVLIVPGRPLILAEAGKFTEEDNKMGDVILGKKVVYYGPEDIRIEDYLTKPDVKDGEVLIKIEACAICGTDVKSFYKGNPKIQAPMTIGHELCGTIVKKGDRVKDYALGDRVTMATTIGCGKCRYCQEGKTNLCINAEAIGFHYPGAMAPYIKIPVRAVKKHHLIKVGDLEAAIASLSEPLSCVINGLSRIPIEKITNALVIGLGPLGMFHALTLRQYGIKDIYCVEFPGKRMEMGKEMGFGMISPEMLEGSYKKITDEEGFDLVILTAPCNEIQARAPQFAIKGGYVSYFASLPRGNEMIQINSRLIHYNELVVYGTSDSTVEHVKKAVYLLKNNTGGFKKLITHVLPMDEFKNALTLIKEGNAVKVVLVP